MPLFEYSSYILYNFLIVGLDGLGTAENIGDFPLNHCKYFIMDYFGTQPLHNNRNLNLKQVLTPYEYDSSNTVIYMVTKQLSREEWSLSREFKGVLWGKDSSFVWKLHPLMLQIANFMEIRTTYSPSASGRARNGPNITHLGKLNITSYLRLLSSSRFLLGVGLPLVGPTALEAISHGAVFINPSFDPPKAAGKAHTSYAYSSQHPFVEKHIPEPYAYTIDINNRSAVDRVMLELMSRKEGDFRGYVHPTHTPLGYVKNVYAIFEAMLSATSLASRCGRSRSGSGPQKHPGNKVYSNFVSYVKDNCGSSSRCRQRQRLPSMQTYELIARFVHNKDLAAEYAEALYDSGIDKEEGNDYWQMGKRHKPDMSMYRDSIEIDHEKSTRQGS